MLITLASIHVLFLMSAFGTFFFSSTLLVTFFMVSYHRIDLYPEIFIFSFPLKKYIDKDIERKNKPIFSKLKMYGWGDLINLLLSMDFYSEKWCLVDIPEF